jgi:hypothetical protein
MPSSSSFNKKHFTVYEDWTSWRGFAGVADFLMRLHSRHDFENVMDACASLTLITRRPRSPHQT